MDFPVMTYEHVDTTNNQITFDVKRTEEVSVAKNGKVDPPHRHNFFTIIIVKKAIGTHVIDFNEYSLGDKQIYFISPGQVHQIIEKQKPYGWVITFSNQFLINNAIDSCFIENINLFTDYGQSPPLLLDNKQYKILHQYSSQLYDTVHSQMQFKEEALSSLLKLFLIACNNFYTPQQQNTQQLHAGSTILKEYKRLVEYHFSEWHLVQQYAEALHVTSDHLNRTIKSLIGKTAKEYLQSRIIVAAKRLLFFTDQTTKEIGYTLGFSEPSNFSNFFKKCTGISPSKFKNKKHE